MARHFHRVDAAAAAVADGRPVDWDLLEAQALADERPVIRQLRRLGVPQAPILEGQAPGRDHHSLRDWTAHVVVAAAGIQVVLATVAASAVIQNGRVGFASPLVFPGTPFVFSLGAAFLLWGGRADRAARALGGFFLLVASAFTGTQTADLLLKNPGITGLAPLWLLALPLDAFLPPFLFTFVVAFPRLPAFVRPQAVATRLVSASWAAALLLFAGNVLLMGLTPEHRKMLVWLDRTRPLDGVYWTAVCGFTLVALGLAGWKSRRVLGEEGPRTVSLLLAVTAGVAPLALTTMMVGMGRPLQTWVIVHRAEVGLLVYGSLLTIPLSTAYLVLSRRVLDVRWTLGRAAVCRVARTVPLFVALFTIGLLVVYLFTHRRETLAQLLAQPLSFGLVAATLSSVLFASRRRAWGSLLDGWFFGERRDFQASLMALTVAVEATTDVRAPARALLEEVNRSLPLGHADMLVPDAQLGAYVPIVGTHHRSLQASSLLTELLAHAREPLSLDLEERHSVAQWLPEDERQWVLDTDCRFVVPVFGTGRHLYGVLAMGPKKSGAPFSRDDRRFLSRLANAGGLLAEARLTAPNAVRGEEARSSASSSVGAALECHDCGGIAVSSQICECGGRLVESPLPAVLAGKFRVERRIGRGGMGVVYRAVDLDLERQVAIKTLPRMSAGESARLRREARAMASLVHPHLASIFGLETWRGVPMLVVEYLPGGTLADRLLGGPLSAAHTINLGKSLASALETMHDSGLLHRDIKPSNIGFQRDGTPKLLDFGLVQLLSESTVERFGAPPGLAGRPSSVEQLGTPAYIPPEGVQPWADDPSRDLWSLALVMYEAVAGENPRVEAVRSERSSAAGKRPIPDVRTFAPECPVALAEFFSRALSRDRGDRPRTARAFRAALSALQHISTV